MNKKFWTVSLLALLMLVIPISTVHALGILPCVAQSEPPSLQEGQTLMGSYVDADVAGVALAILVFRLGSCSGIESHPAEPGLLQAKDAFAMTIRDWAQQ